MIMLMIPGVASKQLMLGKSHALISPKSSFQTTGTPNIQKPCKTDS
jgi:hypothetical protein